MAPGEHGHIGKEGRVAASLRPEGYDFSLLSQYRLLEPREGGIGYSAIGKAETPDLQGLRLDVCHSQWFRRCSVGARAYLCQSVGGENSWVLQLDLVPNPSSANLPAV